MRRDMVQINKLLDREADINLIDNKGRNLLHYAINMSSASADATFEVEELLIERGVEINHIDNKGRTPLHYAFVKIKNWQDNSQIDPIEQVSSLKGTGKLEMNIQDKWGKTPLHYASLRGSSCSAKNMIAGGASLSITDVYGNTPLGVALTNSHFNYALLLLTCEGIDVMWRTFLEDPKAMEEKWKKEAKEKKKAERQ